MSLEERENKRKKSIVNSMISDPLEEANEANAQDISRTININIVPKVKMETRSKRINLLITPSVYADAQKKCNEMGISLNECINQFLTNWVHT
jgi:predicted HicB family RNase H-like nuclease